MKGAVGLLREAERVGMGGGDPEVSMIAVIAVDAVQTSSCRSTMVQQCTQRLLCWRR